MKIIAVGEAYGEQEEIAKRPFVGQSGQELRKMFKEAGIDPTSIHYTNVFNLRPDRNDLRNLCLSKIDVIRELAAIKLEQPDPRWPATYTLQPLAGAGKYLRPKYLPEVWRLQEELSRGWDLCFALGNSALWALFGHTGVSKLRGYVAESKLLSGCRIMPTYHPSAVLRNWSLRPIVITDFKKSISTSRAKRKEIWISPSIGDIKRWIGLLKSDAVLSIDIETKPARRHITCVGFSADDRAICIPFWDRRTNNGSYWVSHEMEIEAWECVRTLLATPNSKVFQNGNYDMQWLFKFLGFPIRGTIHDTMLIHHALQPEMSKDLNFLGSVYTHNPVWKNMRKRAKLSMDSEKSDD
jgi:uracil-DNA glycosylase